MTWPRLCRAPRQTTCWHVWSTRTRRTRWLPKLRSVSSGVFGRVADLQIDPVLDSSARPDALSHKLFGSAGPAIIEITALSDDVFSGETDMERAANIVCQFANRVRRGFGRASLLSVPGGQRL